MASNNNSAYQDVMVGGNFDIWHTNNNIFGDNKSGVNLPNILWKVPKWVVTLFGWFRD